MQNDAPGNRWSQRFSFTRRFRNSAASAHTLGTINTVLPEYTLSDPSIDLPPDFHESPTSGIFSAASESIASSSRLTLDEAANSVSVLPRYSYINPRYSTILSFPAHEHHHGAVHDTQDHQFEHTFPVRANKPWCTLHIFTQCSIPGNPDMFPQKPKIPRLWGGQAMAGMLSFDMQSSQTIQQIKIKLKGKIITSALEGGSKTFLEHEVLLWRKGSAGSGATPSASELNGKFIGKHNFPFSFPFPTHVNASSLIPVIPPAPKTIYPFLLDPEWSSEKRHTFSTDESKRGRLARSRSFQPPSNSRRPQAFLSEKGAVHEPGSERKFSERNGDPANECDVSPIPQTFLEKETIANIQYELSVLLEHSRFRADSKIRTNVGFVPSIIPRPVSFKRRKAYEMGALPPGPVTDPEGWFALPEAVIEGELGGLGGRKVRIDCTLYLANPLSYTRGTSIPVYLDLSSEDSNALNTLCTPKTPYIRLVRRIQYFTHVTSFMKGHEADNPRQNGLPETFGVPMNGMLALSTDKSGTGGDLRTDLHEVDIGIWWVPPKDVLQEPNLRHLGGEIHLNLDLQPSCASTIFSVEYSVEMLPFNTNIFEMTRANESAGRTRKEAIISHPVEVATLFAADAPVPVPFSKPPKRRILVDLQEESEGILRGAWELNGVSA